jgi:hypothetical protein
MELTKTSRPIKKILLIGIELQFFMCHFNRIDLDTIKENP